MKALLVTHDFPPELGGGISNYYHHLCRELAGSVSVLAPRCRTECGFDADQPFAIYRRPIPIAPPGMMKVDRYPPLRWPRAALLAAAQWMQFYRHARRLMKRDQADIGLMGHLYLAPLGAPLRRATGCRFGVILHGSELHRFIGWAPVRRLMLSALNAADFLVVNSEFTRSQYLSRGVRPSQRFVKVHPGVDTDVFRPDVGDRTRIRQQYGVGERPVVLSVARLVPWKGQDVMLRSFPRVLARVPEAVYLIVGDGPYRAALERLVDELGLGEHVIFAGYAAERDLPAYYRAANLVAGPTREVADGMPLEGFGIVYLEAGACGTPVIGGRGGGTAESIEDGVTGIRVDPNSTEELADAVVRLLEDPELAERLGRGGRERAVRLFDWSVQAHRLRAFLDEMVGDEPRDRAPDRASATAG